MCRRLLPGSFAPRTALAGLMLAGCAGGQQVAPSSARSPAAEPAVSITMVQSGGIAGGSRVVKVDQETSGAGRALELASRLGRADFPPHTEIPCCDRSVYTLTIRHRPGATTRIVTFDGDGSPAYDLAMAMRRLQPH